MTSAGVYMTSAGVSRVYQGSEHKALDRHGVVGILHRGCALRRPVSRTSASVYMTSAGVYITSAGVYITSVGVHMTSAGVCMTSEGVYMTSAGVSRVYLGRKRGWDVSVRV